MLLYIHVPFCRQKCGYCAFYSQPLPGSSAGADRMADYLAGLLVELRLWGGRLGNVPVETVFFGGGTPSLLPEKALAGILEAVACTFSLADNAEITVEANPESALENAWLFGARSAGVNRLSFGVQSFDDASLALLGRVHDGKTAEAAFHTARAAGFTNISLDFMWGLPGCPIPQSQMQWLGTLRKACSLQPEHISAYGLTLEPDSPLEISCAGGAYMLPGEKELGSMYVAGGEFLEGHGYMQYEISNYARMGYICRHNQGYWEGEDYLGLGPAATSTLAARRWTNPADIAAWRALVTSGGIADECEVLDQDTLRKEALMLSLRTTRGLDLAAWRKRWSMDFLKQMSSLTTALQQNGLASVRSGRFRLTRAGMLVSDAILSHFFDRLEALPGNSQGNGATLPD